VDGIVELPAVQLGEQYQSESVNDGLRRIDKKSTPYSEMIFAKTSGVFRPAKGKYSIAIVGGECAA
jgi:hypothetical protein